ncbi:Protein FANTASTIC FOUR 1 [Bienertia sinuspersici]
MSTIVYKELQSSSLESYLNESRTLSLKLSASKLGETCSSCIKDISNSKTYGSFSSIEALSSKRDRKESVYVHPLVKRSSFMLSDKSLQMCTESLGSETGSGDMESGTIFPPMTVEMKMVQTLPQPQPRKKLDKMKKEVVAHHGKFPPPLTTITGSNPIQVKPYRENGRLVIQAVSSPPIQSYMQAERRDGRLKLTLFNNFIDVDECRCSFDQRDDSCNCQIKDYNGVESNFVEDEGQQQKYVEENTYKQELEGCSYKNYVYLFEDDVVNNGEIVEFGVKLGLGKLQRPSRCKERGQGNKRLINWEPFWVAT